MRQVSPDEAVTRAKLSLDRLEDEFLRCYYAARLTLGLLAETMGIPEPLEVKGSLSW